MSERPSWLVVALAGAGGFFAGVVLIALLGGPKGTVHTRTKIAIHTRTRTLTRTETVTKTVDSTPKVPDVIGQSLDDAQDQLRDAGYDVDVSDDTIFGILDAGNYVVTDQDPAAGEPAPPSGKVTLTVRRA